MIDAEALRTLVREVVEGELARVKAPGPRAHTVTIASDADLVAFARSVLRLADDPGARAAIVAGTYPFVLASATAAPAAKNVSPSATVESGVVTESSLARLPKGTLRLLLAEGVTVTPLARDRARRLGLTIERMKP